MTYNFIYVNTILLYFLIFFAICFLKNFLLKFPIHSNHLRLMKQNFIHLHVHSHYSLLDGLAKIDALIEKAKKYEMPALALTDHGVMYGIIEFYEKAKKAGIKPIVGLESYVAPRDLHKKEPRIDSRAYHMTLWAKNLTGYRNLLKLSSISHLEGFYYKPRIDEKILAEYSKGIMAGSGCLAGWIPRLILAKNIKGAEEKIKFYQKILGKENFFLEVMPHAKLPEQMEVNKALFELSKKTKAPLIATADIHYINPEDKEAHDLLLAIQTKTTIDDETRMTMKEDVSFKSPEFMADFFKNHPEALENTIQVAEEANLEIELNKIRLPKFSQEKGFDSNKYIQKLAKEGLKKRYKKITPEIEKRFNYELSIIQKMNFSDYFLIVQDFILWAKNNGIVVGPARGSAGGSLISYVLGITEIDPLKYNLLFERFLNPERISMPDIDVDFDDKRRDEVIKYVEKKYGKDKVARIVTFGTMAARPSIRDAGRALGYPYSFCDALAKSIPTGMNLAEALEKSPDFFNFYRRDERAKKLIDIAKKLEGITRHASVHACGVVISDEPLTKRTPLQRSPQNPEVTITQYEMHAIEKVGLLKMDFLGLKNLTLIQEATSSIFQSEGREIKVSEIPLDDKETFKLMQKGKTVGIFQFESEGMRKTLRGVKPDKFEDLIAVVALFRPGPAELIPTYIKRKQGKEKVTYLHPQLKPILEPTYGILIYQEQLMKIAQVLAGFSLAEADVLRKAVGKKIKELLDEQKSKLVEGMKNNKISQQTADKIWEWIQPFARYGFNKSHATAYALIGYWTAYLKSHYPVEFMAAVLNSEKNDLDRISFLIEEMKKSGITVLPPRINQSYKNFQVIKNGKKEIIFGLGAIKNVGEAIVEAIIEEREKNGSFQSIEDFLRRIKHKDLNKKSMESLIKAGVFSKLEDRLKLLTNIEELLRFNRDLQSKKNNVQNSLFGQTDFSLKPLTLKEAKETSLKERLAWEKELLGLYISGHPLDELEIAINNHHININELDRERENTLVEIVALVDSIKKIITRSGKPMIFVKVEDKTGSVEVVVFNSVLNKTLDVWQEGKILRINGRLTRKEEIPKILCEDAKIVG